MNTLNCIKRKMREKRRSVVVGSVASAAVSVTASSSFAAIDYSPVQSLITTAVSDIFACGLILPVTPVFYSAGIFPLTFI